MSVTSSHLRSRCGSAILADVDLRGLCQIKLVVGGLLHQVVKGILEHEFDHVDEVVLEEHSLAEDFLVTALDLIQPRGHHQLLFVLSSILVAEGRLLRIGEGGGENLETRWFLVSDVRAHQARRPLLTVS